MMNKGDINKITNNYILKSLFGYLKYEKLLKLINNNKGLQNRLGINLQNYKEISNFPKYEYIKYEKIFKKIEVIKGPIEYFFEFCTILCMTCIFFIYSLIYSILLVSKDSFDDNNSKDNSSVNIINRINACTFILDIVTLVTPFLLSFIFTDYETDYGLKKYKKTFIIIIINLTHFSFEGLIIWKLVLSYKIIKEGSITWFMIMDYFFIILNFFYIIYILIFSFIYFIYCGKNIKITPTIELSSFNDIKINAFSLPKGFIKWKLKERKKYVMNNYKNYTYNITKEQYYLINKINYFRDQEGLLKLRVDNKIPDFIIDKPALLIFNSEENFFKFSNTQFLFKFHKGNFKENFEKRNENIINIISKAYLNQINIISQGEYEYVFIYENLGDYYDYFDNPYVEEKYRGKEYQKFNLDNDIYDTVYNKISKKYIE